MDYGDYSNIIKAILVGLGLIFALGGLVRKILKDRDQPAPLTGATKAPAARPPAAPTGDPLTTMLDKMEADGQKHPWARSFSSKDLHHFLELVGVHYVRLGFADDADSAKTVIIMQDFLFPQSPTGLDQLAPLCQRADRASWPKLVDEHFVGMDQRKAIGEKREDYEAVKEQIMPRLFPASILKQEGVSVVGKRYLPDVAVVMVFDTVDACMNVTADDLAKWGKTDDELTRVAFANLAKKYPPEFKDMEIDGLNCKILADNSPFDASYALAIKQHPQLCGASGALIGVPSTDVMVVVPIHDDEDVEDRKKALAPVIVHNYSRYEVPVSYHLYWYKDGRFQKLEVDPDSVVPEVPGWAPFETKEDFHLFLETAMEYFTKRGFTTDLDAATGGLTVPEQPYQGSQMYLGNVASVCAQIEKQHWAEAVKDHFSSFETSIKEGEDVGADRKDFEKVKHLIMPRLYPIDYLEYKDKMVMRSSLEDTLLTLVFDLPTSIVNVQPDDVAAWGKGEDELYRLAFQNLRATYPPAFEQMELSGDAKIQIMAEENFFNPTYALFLEQFEGLLGQHGTVVGVPHRGALLCYPMEDQNFLNVIHQLAFIVTGMYKDGPGSLSPHLYWYHQGEFRRLPFRIGENNKFEFMPPAEFVEMMTKLMEESGQGRDG